MLRFSIVAGALVCLLVSLPLSAQEDSSNRETLGSIEVLDPALKDLIDPASPIEVLTTGYQWSEGPVWIKDKSVLLFSDVPQNKIHSWSPKTGHSIFMDPSGSIPDFVIDKINEISIVNLFSDVLLEAERRLYKR